MFHWIDCPPPERGTPTPHCSSLPDAVWLSVSLLPNQQKAQCLYGSFLCMAEFFKLRNLSFFQPHLLA